jgi:hypothetical protein
MNYYSVFPYDFFLFFPKLSKLVKNYNYNKTKSYGESVVVFLQNTMDCYNIFLNGFFFYFIWENTVVFLTKHCQLIQRFSSWVFFIPKLSLLVFF